MYLRHKASGDVVEVLDIAALANPYRTQVVGRFHAGEELQDPANFDKDGLAFLSGEALPRCWVDASYQSTR